jgi:hypothetical protein
VVNKETLIRYAEAIHALRTAHPEVSREQPTLFFRFLMPWLVRSEGDNRDQIAKGAEVERKLLTGWGFAGEKMADEVRATLAEDAHLAQCCRDPLALSYVLDKHFVRPAADLISENATARLDELYATFHRTIFEQGPFTLVSYSHVFNLDSALDHIDLGGVHLHKLTHGDVAGLLSEPAVPSAVSFLQPPNVGTFFLTQEEPGAGKDDFEWFMEHHFRSMELLRVLQYSKDGVLHIDYSVPHFRPPWVNELRRSGLFFLGTPRRTPYMGGNSFVVLTEADLPALRKKMELYLSEPIASLLADESPAFRQASLLAGDYYEKSQTYESPIERLISLAIALESLLSPGDSGEYSFRISQTASQLIGKTAAEKREIYDDLRKLYGKRSKVMHGTYNVQQVYQGTYVTHEDIDRWSSLVKRGLLATFTLFLRGKRSDNDLAQFRTDLLMGALDSDAAEQLRKQSDLDVFLDDYKNGHITFA